MNKVNVFRVDNPMFRIYNAVIGLGPYHFFQSCASKETSQQWHTHTAKHEPSANIYQKHKIDVQKITFVPTLPNETRPGPFEDIGLRSQFLEQVGRSKSVTNKNIVYCFDSLNQCQKWFHDPNELQFLAHNGFVISQYVVTETSLMRGTSQCVFFAEGLCYLKTRLTLLGHTPILPIYTPPKVKNASGTIYPST